MKFFNETAIKQTNSWIQPFYQLTRKLTKGNIVTDSGLINQSNPFINQLNQSSQSKKLDWAGLINWNELDWWIEWFAARN